MRFCFRGGGRGRAGRRGEEVFAGVLFARAAQLQPVRLYEHVGVLTRRPLYVPTSSRVSYDLGAETIRTRNELFWGSFFFVRHTVRVWCCVRVLCVGMSSPLLLLLFEIDGDVGIHRCFCCGKGSRRKTSFFVCWWASSLSSTATRIIVTALVRFWY